VDTLRPSTVLTSILTRKRPRGSPRNLVTFPKDDDNPNPD
jgi:hypothetical protein